MKAVILASHRRKIMGIIFVIVGFVLLPLSSSLAKAIRIGSAGVGGLFLPVWVAQDKGLFKRYGLDTEVITFQGGPLAVQALVAGDIQFTAGGISSGVNARIAGAEIVAIATFVNTLPYTLVASEKIKLADQLKGKRFGVSRFGAADYIALKVALPKYGIDPEKEAVLVQVGNQSARFGALKGGTVDATLISPPLTLTARKLGFNSVISFQRTGIKWTYNSVLVSTDFANRDRHTIVNFLKGFVEGIAYLRRNKEESLGVLSKWMGLKDREALEESYGYVLEVLPRKPYTDQEGMQALLSFIGEGNPKAKRFKPQDFNDMRFLQELDQSGFIDRLYQ